MNPTEATGGEGENFISDEDVASLVREGVPAEVALIVQTRRGMSKSSYAVSLILFLLVTMVLMMGFAFLPLLPPFQRLLIAFGRIDPEAILVNYPSVGSVFGVFLGIFTTGILFCLATMINRNLAIRSSITAVQQMVIQPKNRALNRWMLRKIHRRIHAGLAPEDYLAAFPRATLEFYLKFFVPTLLVTGLFVTFDIAALGYATEDKISIGRYFTFQRKEFTWDEVETISTGCNPRGNRPSLRYHLHLPGDLIRDLEDYRPMKPRSTSKLEMLWRIDERLREHRVPWQPAVFTGGLYKGQSLYDRSCFLRFRRRLSDEEWVKFIRVYRADPDDPGGESSR